MERGNRMPRTMQTCFHQFIVALQAENLADGFSSVKALAQLPWQARLRLFQGLKLVSFQQVCAAGSRVTQTYSVIVLLLGGGYTQTVSSFFYSSVSLLRKKSAVTVAHAKSFRMTRFFAQGPGDVKDHNFLTACVNPDMN